MHCPHCTVEVEKSDLFCGQCGTKLENAVAVECAAAAESPDGRRRPPIRPARNPQAPPPRAATAPHPVPPPPKAPPRRAPHPPVRNSVPQPAAPPSQEIADAPAKRGSSPVWQVLIVLAVLLILGQMVRKHGTKTTAKDDGPARSQQHSANAAGDPIGSPDVESSNPESDDEGPESRPAESAPSESSWEEVERESRQAFPPAAEESAARGRLIEGDEPEESEETWSRSAETRIAEVFEEYEEFGEYDEVAIQPAPPRRRENRSSNRPRELEELTLRDADLRLLVPAGNPQRIRSVYDLRDAKAVAVMSDRAAGIVYNKVELHERQYKDYGSLEDAESALRRGEIGAVVFDAAGHDLPAVADEWKGEEYPE